MQASVGLCGRSAAPLRCRSARVPGPQPARAATAHKQCWHTSMWLPPSNLSCMQTLHAPLEHERQIRLQL